MSRDYRKIMAWQRADAFAGEVYAATRGWPATELHEGGLGGQLRQAAVGAAAHIVEASARRGDEPFLEGLAAAQASLARADYFLSLAQTLGYVEEGESVRLQELRGEAAGLLYGFRAWLEKNPRDERRAQEVSEAV